MVGGLQGSADGVLVRAGELEARRLCCATQASGTTAKAAGHQRLGFEPPSEPARSEFRQVSLGFVRCVSLHNLQGARSHTTPSLRTV
jgi:hypothetical protein